MTPDQLLEPGITVLETVESRWFFEGSAPAAIRGWFAEGRSLTVEERADHYLVFPGCESVGVKLRDAGPGRESRFEVKAIRGAPEVISLARDVAGRADAWVKWSYAMSALEHLPSVDTESTWVQVRKQRVLQTFSTERGSLQEEPIDEPPTAGCSVDLVDLDTVDGAWWTIGFESFGPATDLRAQLHAVATAWFERRPPPVPLRVASSIAYPTWVAGLHEGKLPG